MSPSPDSPYLADASGYRGWADRIIVARDEPEIADILREASATRTPVTISGAGTGVTGGRVPQSGWLLSVERLNSIEIHPGFAVCGAGALLRDLQAAAAPHQFYAPDPTENGASIGGTLVSNASGSRSFLYGATRRHVRALRVVLMSGEILALKRGEKPPFDIPMLPAPPTTKNTAGYYMRPGIDYMDLFIGSEGTLGVVTQAELALLPASQPLSMAVVFFESDDQALDAVDAWRPVPGLRMLEYADAAALDLLRPRFPDIPRRACACLLIEAGNEDWLDKFMGMEDSWFAASTKDRERFRVFRHALPEAINDLVRRRGLTKMGSDFAVPISRNREMLRIYRETLDRELPDKYVIFGHIGDAHLHVNILPANEKEWKRGNELMTEFARQAFALNGTVSAEHGLGKRKRHLLSIQYTPDQIEVMKQIKTRLDPQWLLGRGNLFEAPV